MIRSTRKNIIGITLFCLFAVGVVVAASFLFQLWLYRNWGGPARSYLVEQESRYHNELSRIATAIAGEAAIPPTNINSILAQSPELVEILVDENGLPRYFINWDNYNKSLVDFPLILVRDEIDRSRLGYWYTELDVLKTRQVFLENGRTVSAASILADGADTPGRPPEAGTEEFQLAIEVLDSTGWDFAVIPSQREIGDDQ